MRSDYLENSGTVSMDSEY